MPQFRHEIRRLFFIADLLLHCRSGGEDTESAEVSESRVDLGDGLKRGDPSFHVDIYLLGVPRVYRT